MAHNVEADEVEYIVPMVVTFQGAEAYVTARSLEEAKQKASEGAWDELDVDTAETSDWHVAGEPEENA